jgi:hypothetical protein
MPPTGGPEGDARRRRSLGGRNRDLVPGGRSSTRVMPVAHLSAASACTMKFSRAFSHRTNRGAGERAERSRGANRLPLPCARRRSRPALEAGHGRSVPRAGRRRSARRSPRAGRRRGGPGDAGPATALSGWCASPGRSRTERSRLHSSMRASRRTSSPSASDRLGLQRCRCGSRSTPRGIAACASIRPPKSQAEAPRAGLVRALA